MERTLHTVVLTFAELAFLLDGSDPSARTRLHLREWDPDSPVASCGMASLVARGVLETGDDGLVPAPVLRPLIDALAAPAAWVEIGFARESSAGGVQIFETAATRLEVTARPFGTFTLLEVDASSPFEHAVRNIVERFLAVAEPGAVFLRTGPANGDEPVGGLAVRRLATGALQVAHDDLESGTVTELSLEDAAAAVEQYVKAG